MKKTLKVIIVVMAVAAMVGLAFGEEKLYGAHVPFPGGDAV